MKNGRSYTNMCKDLFCVELKKKHFSIKLMVTSKNGKKSQRGMKSPSHTEPARIGVGRLSVSVSTNKLLLQTCIFL